MTYTDQEVPDGAESVALTGILEIKQLNGRFGPFPVAWLDSPLGRFRINDSWIETLDPGEYRGTFHAYELSLYGYRAYGEQRTCILAKIAWYKLDDYADGGTPEPQWETDPLEEEAEVDPEFRRESPQPADGDQDEAIMLLQSFDGEWQYGADYKIDTTLPRTDIIACRNALKALGYAIDVKTQRYRLEVQHG